MNIDWSKFDKFSENSVECHCGAAYRSHTKAVAQGEQGMVIMSRKACPSCGRHDNVRAARSGPESFTISGIDYARTGRTCSRAPNPHRASECTEPEKCPNK